MLVMDEFVWNTGGTIPTGETQVSCRKSVEYCFVHHKTHKDWQYYIACRHEIYAIANSFFTFSEP
jgi:hypothetical protein